MKKSPKPGTLSKRQIAARREEATSKPHRNKLVHYDLQELKGLLPEYFKTLGIELRWKNPHSFECLCPLHPDRKPSFSARLINGIWVWKCWPCDLGGTVIDLHAALSGLSPASRQAIVGTANALNREPMASGETVSIRRSSTRAGMRINPTLPDSLTEALSKRRLDLLSRFESADWEADLWHASPLVLDQDPARNGHLMIGSLFAPNDILWLGDLKDSGRSKHAHHFKRRDDWCNEACLPPRIASGTFQKGSFNRNYESLQNSSFFIIEADELIGRKPGNQAERDANQRLSAALISLLENRLKLRLRAVVDTGGKSLHAWFERPSDEGMAALDRVLKGLGIDLSVFKQSAIAPLRLPGCKHHETGKAARLLYLNPKNPHE